MARCALAWLPVTVLAATLPCCAQGPQGAADPTVLEGDVRLETPADVEAIQGIHRITGALAIAPGPDLAGVSLPALEQVDGGLALSGVDERPEAWVLDAPALRVVGRDLTAEGSHSAVVLRLPALEEVGAQVALRSVRATLDAPELARVGGGVRVTQATLEGLSLPRLAYVGGSFELRQLTIGTDGPAHLALPALAELGDDLLLQEASETTFDLPALAQVGGDVELSRMQGGLLLPRLAAVVGSVRIDAALLRALDLSALAEVGGRLEVRDTALDHVPLQLPALATAIDGIDIDSVSGLEDLTLGALTRVGAEISIRLCPHLRTVDLTALAQTGGDLQVRENAAIDVRLPALESIGGNLVMRDNAASQLHAPALRKVFANLEIAYTRIDALEAPHLESVGWDATLAFVRWQADVASLPALTWVGGDLVVQAVDQLRTLDLPALQDIGNQSVAPNVGSLDVLDNEHLEALALGALAHVLRDVLVQRNAALASEDVDQLLQGVDVGGAVAVCENRDGLPVCGGR